MRGDWAARAVLGLCGAGIELWALSALLEAPGANIPRHVLTMLAASALYVLALALVVQGRPVGVRVDLALIFGVAVLVRATFLFTTPSLSDDVYRAVWDARLLHAGVNPYAFAPAAPELAGYRDEAIWSRINHKEQHTPYPPVAELLGAGAYGLLPERPLAMQALAVGSDLAAAGLLAAFLARIGSDPRRSLAIAWSPAGALHFAHSGHNDAAMVALVVAAALLLVSDRRALGLAALGLATAAKAAPALMLPAFLRAAGPGTALAWVAAGAAVTVPFLGAGPGLVAGLASEGGQRFNDSAYLVVERLAGALAPGAGAPAATGLAAAVVLTVAATSWVRGDRSPEGTLVGGLRTVAAYLLVAPVVEPWYFTWLAPVVALRLARGSGAVPFAPNDALAWLWLGATAILTDLTYPPGGSALWPQVRAIEYVPAYALLGVAAWQRWRNRGRTVR